MSTSDEEYVDAKEFLEELRGGPLTFGRMVASLRKCDEINQTQMAKKLGISRAKLCDVEKGRRSISVDRAREWARIFGHSEHFFASLLIEDKFRRSGEEVTVTITPKKALPKKKKKSSSSKAA